MVTRPKKLIIKIAKNVVPKTALSTILAGCCLASSVLAGESIHLSVQRTGQEQGASSFSLALSGDGSVVAYLPLSPQITTGSLPSTFLRNGGIIHLNDRSRPTQIDHVASGGDGDGVSLDFDGTLLGWDGRGERVADDTNDEDDAYVYDTSDELYTRVSVRSNGDQIPIGTPAHFMTNTAVSGNGRYAIFSSNSTFLLNGNTDPLSFAPQHIYRHDLQTGMTQLVSAQSSPIGQIGNGDSFVASISDDGRYVAFTSTSSNLVAGLIDDNNQTDVFIRDMAPFGSTRLVSMTIQGGVGDGESYRPVISGDGEKVAFLSSTNDLTSEDNNALVDAFVYNRVGATMRRLATPMGNGTIGATTLDINFDGTLVAFTSELPLVPGDQNTTDDAFVYDLTKTKFNVIERISESTSVGFAANGNSAHPKISNDGRYIAFSSDADDVAEDFTGTVYEGEPQSDVYLRDRGPECNSPTKQLPIDTWIMISLPCSIVGGVSVEEAFGDDIPNSVYNVDWVMFKYDPTLLGGNYVPLLPTDLLESGVGYWVIQLAISEVTLDLPTSARGVATNFKQTNVCPAGSQGCYTIALSGYDRTGVEDGTPVWNMVGYPFQQDTFIPYEEITIVTDTDQCSEANGGCDLEQALDVGLAVNVMFHYDGKEYITKSPGTAILPWEGLWVGELKEAAGNSPRLVFAEPE